MTETMSLRESQRRPRQSICLIVDCFVASLLAMTETMSLRGSRRRPRQSMYKIMDCFVASLLAMTERSILQGKIFMIIKQLYTNNSYRNFNYLIACPNTGEALAIDPLAVDLCLKTANQNGWRITQILNTHEHWDHIGGNDAMQAATQAKILAHHAAVDRIGPVNVPLHANDIITVGNSVRLSVLDTPGHTRSHVCLLAEGDHPALFCGDTLFNAGAGNCHHGGHPELLYTTFQDQISLLPQETTVYPGHDYIVNNLNFTLSREPDNEHAKSLLSQVSSQDPHHPLVTTLALEKQINVFLRLDSPHSAHTIEKRHQTFT